VLVALKVVAEVVCLVKLVVQVRAAVVGRGG